MYAREVSGEVLSFGVSGLLWNDNVLMYDRQSESLWSQVKRQAVTGPKTGATLRVLRSTVTTWKKWRRRHPATLVLTTSTGYRRDYSKDPYEDYYRSQRGLFSVFRGGPGEAAKELVAGVELAGETVAYPVELVRRAGSVRDTVGATALVVEIEPATETLVVTTVEGRSVEVVVTYWMVWKGLYPDSRRYRAP